MFPWFQGTMTHLASYLLNAATWGAKVRLWVGTAFALADTLSRLWIVGLYLSLAKSDWVREWAYGGGDLPREPWNTDEADLLELNFTNTNIAQAWDSPEERRELMQYGETYLGYDLTCAPSCRGMPPACLNQSTTLEECAGELRKDSEDRMMDTYASYAYLNLLFLCAGLLVQVILSLMVGKTKREKLTKVLQGTSNATSPPLQPSV